MLPEKDLTRLARLLGMLGSNHDGEVASAGRMAHRLVATHKLSWDELLKNGTQPGSVDKLYTQDDIVASYNAGLHEGMKQGMDQARAAEAVAKFRSTNQYRRSLAPWRAWCQDALDEAADDLSEWEYGFLESFIQRGFDTPTPKQEAVMRRIATKIGIAPPNF
jgi:hypothetical protein